MSKLKAQKPLQFLQGFGVEIAVVKSFLNIDKFILKCNNNT